MRSLHEGDVALGMGLQFWTNTALLQVQIVQQIDASAQLRV
jgi:hypothetical protein